MVTAVEEVPVTSVPVRERRGPRFFDPHGPPTEGDFASAGRRTAVPDFGAAALSSGITVLSRVDSSVPSTAVEAPTSGFCPDCMGRPRGAAWAQQRGG